MTEIIGILCAHPVRVSIQNRHVNRLSTVFPFKQPKRNNWYLIQLAIKSKLLHMQPYDRSEFSIYCILVCQCFAIYMKDDRQPFSQGYNAPTFSLFSHKRFLLIDIITARMSRSCFFFAELAVADESGVVTHTKKRKRRHAFWLPLGIHGILPILIFCSTRVLE